MSRWWREQYGETRAFEDLTWADVYEQFYAQLWKRLNELKENIKHTTNGSERARMASAIDDLQTVFADDQHVRELATDKLVESWEDMLDRGELPDFTADMSEEVKRKLGITE